METDKKLGKKVSRKGMALFVVLGLVLVFSMMGFLGLKYAEKDSEITGSYIDQQSKEVAAWSGIQMALGRMAANPDSTVAQLNLFIADSSATTKRQYFDFSNGARPFSLSATAPAFFSIAGGGDQSSVRVSIKAIELGATGSWSGVGTRIILEATGRGRRGDQQTIVASYRINGVDQVIQVNSSASSNTAPVYALYMGTGANNLDAGSSITGNVYLGSSSKLQGTSHIYGKLNVNGNLETTTALTIDSNAFVAGDFGVQGAAPTFAKNLVVGGGIMFTLNYDFNVTGSFYMRGTGGCLQIQQSDKTMNVSGDFYAPGFDCFMLQSSAWNIGGNAWVNRIDGSGNDASIKPALKVGGNLELLWNDNATSYLPSMIIGGNLAARNNNGSLSFYRQNGIRTHTVTGNLYQKGSMGISASDGVTINGAAYIGNGFATSALNASPVFKSHLYLTRNNQGGSDLGSRPDIWGNLLMNGSVNQATFWTSGWTLHGGTFSYNHAGGWGNVWGDGSTNHTRVTDTVMPSANALVGTLGSPKTLAQLGYTFLDTNVSKAFNPRDTVDTSVIPLKYRITEKLVCDSLFPGYDCGNNVFGSGGISSSLHFGEGDYFDTIYNRAAKKGWLYNNYLVLFLDGTSWGNHPTPPNPPNFDGSIVTTKIIYVITAAMGDWSEAWPGGSPTSRQLVYVPNKRAGMPGWWSSGFAQWGIQANKTFYGWYFTDSLEGGSIHNGSNSTIEGALEIGAPSGGSVQVQGGNATVRYNTTVLADLAAVAVNFVKPSVNARTGGTGTTTTTTLVSKLVLHRPVLQFERVWEFR
jgi:hypothetical protein